MVFDDLKLIFDTERRILKRRLKELWGRPSAGRGERRRTLEKAQGEDGPTAAPRSTAGVKRGPRASTPPSSRPPNPRPFPARSVKKPTPIRGRPARGQPWGNLLNLSISLIVHLTLLAILIPQLNARRTEEVTPRELDVTVRLVSKNRPIDPEPTPPAPEAEKPQTPKIVPEPEPVPAEIETETETPPAPAAPPEPAPRLHGRGGGGTPSGQKSRIGARSGEKAEALRVFGGGTETEVAVANGLRWLARHQDCDGSWDPEGFTRHCAPGLACGGPGYEEYRVGVTGLCVLAFLGAGIDGNSSHAHREVARGGLEYLLLSQDDRGCFGSRRHNYMYNHAIAAFCLAEAALLSGTRRYAEAAQRGLRFSATAQQPQGGWDYTSARTLRNDLSITGWQIMALNTAEEAGIPFDAGMKEKVLRFVRRAVHRSGWATYADRGIGANRGGISIASVGLLCKLYLGWSTRSPELLRSAQLILRHPPDAEARLDWDRTYQSSYYWYYATLSLFHLGGDEWEAWNTLLKRELLPLQRQSDGRPVAAERGGSWDPDPNWIGASGGRVTTTALNILSFEVYYRYRPLHEKLGLPRESEERRRKK